MEAPKRGRPRAPASDEKTQKKRDYQRNYQTARKTKITELTADIKKCEADLKKMKEERKQLVGLLTDDPSIVLEEGAQIVSELNQSPVNMLGHVTSSYYSPNLKKSIALAVVRSGKNMMGKKLFIPMEDKTINVTVANPVFFDTENKRLNA